MFVTSSGWKLLFLFSPSPYHFLGGWQTSHEACTIKQNPGSWQQLECFCTMGCGSEGLKSEWLKNNANCSSYVPNGLWFIIFMKKYAKGSGVGVRKWSWCFPCEFFFPWPHFIRISGSGTQASLFLKLFRWLQGQSRLKATANLDNWFLNPATHCIAREDPASWLPLPEVPI